MSTIDIAQEVNAALSDQELQECPSCGSREELVPGTRKGVLYCPHCGVARVRSTVTASPAESTNPSMTITVQILPAKKVTQEKRPWGFFRTFLTGMGINIFTTVVFALLASLAHIGDGVVAGSLLIAWFGTATLFSVVAGVVIGGANGSVW